MGCDLAIVHCPVGGGHVAVAEAIAEVARGRGLDVAVLDAFEHAPRWLGHSYRGTHLAGQTWTPQLYGAGYAASNRSGGALDSLRRAVDGELLAPLRRRVVALGARAVIATHHLPLAALAHARARGRLASPLIAAVTDYGAHAVWAEPGVDAFAVGCERARGDLVLHGVDRARVAITGIAVHPRFERVTPLRAPRRDERLRVLLSAGGFGAGRLAPFALALGARADVDLTVVCGRSEPVRAALEDARARGRLRARVLGFERDMAARMAEAHVVAGKAGGATVTEALHAGRPLLLLGTVPGQEEHNERFALFGGAAVAATTRTIGRAVALLRHRDVLEELASAARALVPRAPASRVVDLAVGVASRGSRAA